MVATANTAETVKTEPVSFMFSDFLLKRGEVERMMNNIQSPILATGSGLADPNVVHLFDSEEAFEAWTRSTQLAGKFAKMHQVVSELQRSHNMSDANFANGAADSDAPRTVVSSSDISNGSGAAEAFDGITSDIAVLYENPNFTGRWFPLGPTAMPNLSIMGLYNQISSLRVSGICMLCDKTWFHGAKLYLVGTPLLEVADLKEWGFNDRAASAIVM
jgi:hypothetical protein